MKYIYIILSLILLSLTISGQQRVYTLSQPDNTGGVYEARDTIRLLKGYGFSATASKTMNARIRPDMLLPAEYQPSGLLPDPNRTLNTSYSVGTTEGTADVSPMGAATYQIPIMVAPGTAGLQPKLLVSYNSQSAGGLLGYGWDLSAISSITRTGRTIYHDGEIKVPSLNDATDNLALDGQRLFLISGSNLQANAKYRTEIESYQDITVKTAGGRKYFEIRDKAGYTFEYGSTDDSYIEAQNTSTPLYWLLSRITDLNGNYITYAYAEKNASGEFYLKEINYTGNSNSGKSPYAKVNFFYETRKDTSSLFIAGREVAATVLLKKIVSSCEGELVREYRFNYVVDNGYSKLTEIEEYGRNRERYNSTIIDWGIEPGYLSKRANIRSDSFGKYVYPPLAMDDFDGDGRMDFMLKPRSADGSDFARLFLGRPNSTGYTETAATIPLGEHLAEMMTGDFNGDGFTDILKVNYEITGYTGSRPAIELRKYYYTIFLYNGRTFVQRGDSVDMGSYRSNDLLLGDFDGDGVTEIFRKSDHTMRRLDGTSFVCTGLELMDAIISRNSSYDEVVPKDTMETYGRYPTYGALKYPLDFSGSGKNQLCAFNHSKMIIYELSGTQFVKLIETTELNGRKKIRFGDFNGDGKMDIFDINEGHPKLYFSTGTGFKVSSLPITITDTARVFSGNFNLDNKADIVTFSENWNSATLYYLNNNQVEVKSSDLYSSSSGTEVYPVFSDFDGDGRYEFVLSANTGAEGHGVSVYSFDDHTNFFVKNIVDGLNNKITFNFTSLADSSVYTETSVGNTVFPARKRVIPMYVLKSVRFRDYAGTDRDSLLYRYGDLRWHAQGKGLLGFMRAEKNNPVQNRKETTVSSYDNQYFNVYVTELLTTTSDDLPINKTTFVNDLISLGGKRIFPFVFRQTDSDQLTHLTTTTDFYYNSASDGNPYKIVRSAGVLRTTEENTWEQKWDKIPFKNVITSTTLTYSGSGASFTETKTFDYDAYCRLIKTVDYSGDPKQTITQFSDFDDYGNACTETLSASGCATVVTEREFDPTGRFIVSETDPLKNVTCKSYDTSTGNVLSETDIEGLIVKNEYNGFGKLTAITDVGGNTTTYSCQWDANNGALYKVNTEDPEIGTVTVWYDAEGNELRTQKPVLDKIVIANSKEYNNKGQVVKEYEPYLLNDSPYFSTEYTYDHYGRLSAKKDINPSYNEEYVTSYTYNGTTTTTTYPDNTTSSVTLNSSGLEAAYKDAAGTVMTYTYNSLGKPASVTTGGVTTTVAYDSRGYRISLKDPNLNNAVTSDYDAYGRLVKETNARGQITTYQYDVLNRQTQVSAPEQTITYQYVTSGNGNGRLASIKVNNSIVKEFTYDAYGSMLSETETFEGVRYKNSYTYDDYFRVREHITPSGLTLVNMYNNGYLTEIRNKQGDASIWKIKEMDVRERIVKSSFGNGLCREVSYDPNYDGLLEGIYLYEGERPNITKWIDRIDYSFNPRNHNLENRNDVTNSRNEVFGYDELSRLTSTKLNNGAVNPITYMPNGNIATKYDVGEYKYSGGNHKLTSVENQVSGYQPSEITFSYNSSNRVTGMTQSGPVIKKAQFTYGYDDERRKMQYYENNALKRTRYYFGNYEKETTGSVTKEFDYIYSPDGLVAIAEKSGSTTAMRYVHTDHLGSIRVITDATKQVLARYYYDAWGVRTLAEGSDVETRGYTGHEHLAAFGLINMNARVYDPVLARFLGMDPFVQFPNFTQNFNRYAYGLNNPLCYIDPSGEFVILSAILVAAAVGFGGYQGYKMGKAQGASGWRMFGYILGGGMIAGVAAGATVATAGLAVPLLTGLGNGALGGIVIGGISGTLGGFVSGFGMAKLGGASVGQALKMGGMGALTGAVGGAVTGGVLQGLSAVRNGGDFWKGVRFKPEIILPDMSKINKPEVPKINLGHGYADVSHGPSSGIGQQLNPSATGSNLPAKVNVPVNPVNNEPFIVTKEGVVLPKGAKIPDNFVRNPHYDISSYGEMVGKDFIEKVRVDPPTPAGFKGPNISHFHLNKGKTHIFDAERWPWWNK